MLSFAKNVLRNELVLHQADSAKIELSPDEMKELRAKFTEVVGSSWDQLGISPKSLADSAKTLPAREKLASARVNAYLDKLMQQQAGFVQVPPPLEMMLKEKYNATIERLRAGQGRGYDHGAEGQGGLDAREERAADGGADGWNADAAAGRTSTGTRAGTSAGSGASEAA